MMTTSCLSLARFLLERSAVESIDFKYDFASNDRHENEAGSSSRKNSSGVLKSVIHAIIEIRQI